MSTEQLIIELDAKTAKLDAKLSRVERSLDDLDGAVKKTDKGLKGIGSAFSLAGKAAASIAAAALAAAAAITTMTLKAASSRRELEIFSKQAKTTAEDFQALSFATKQYGINAEQIGDISKDISDKIGEFATAGTGAFQDYADVMKLTKEEARTLAQEFIGMSSQEVLGQMVSSMEGANVSADQMLTLFEALGNDSSKLIPLFSNNSKELNTLKARFDSVNKIMNITAGQAEKLKEVATSFDLIQASMGNSATAISATIAPVMNDFFNDVIKIVPTATQAIIDFANSFLAAENISSIAGVNKEIAAGQERIDELTEKINSKRQRGKELIKADREIERERLADLKEQLAVLEDQEKLAEARVLKGGEIGGEKGSGLGLPGTEDSGIGTGDEIAAIEDRFKTELELLQQKLDMELEIIGDNDELKLNLFQEFEDNKNKIAEKASKEKLKIDDQRQKTEQSLERQNISSIMSIISALVGHNSDVGKLLFIGSQGLAASEVFFNTQVASMKAIAELGPIAGPPVAAGIQTAGNLSIAAIAATTFGSLASSGGGGGGAASISAPSNEQQAPQNFEPETASFELNDATASGSQSINITVPDGDEIGQAIANWISKAQNEGRA